jgi:hypothetical protein
MIPELLRFVEIDDDTKRRGHEIWDLLAPRADAIVEDFYSKVQAFDISAHITDAAIRRLKIKQKQHWASLFGSQFDEEYANSVRRVGIKHRDIDLGPMWYVAGYMALKIAFTDAITDSPLPPIKKSRQLMALDKFVALDMALALSTYSAAVFD